MVPCQKKSENLLETQHDFQPHLLSWFAVVIKLFLIFKWKVPKQIRFKEYVLILSYFSTYIMGGNFERMRERERVCVCLREKERERKRM